MRQSAPRFALFTSALMAWTVPLFSGPAGVHEDRRRTGSSQYLAKGPGRTLLSMAYDALVMLILNNP